MMLRYRGILQDVLSQKMLDLCGAVLLWSERSDGFFQIYMQDLSNDYFPKLYINTSILLFLSVL